MKGMIKIDQFIIEETGVRVVILGDKDTNGRLLAMAVLTPPKGFIMTADHGCIPDPAIITVDNSKSDAINTV